MPINGVKIGGIALDVVLGRVFAAFGLDETVVSVVGVVAVRLDLLLSKKIVCWAKSRIEVMFPAGS
jgi:hypothetical protein